MDERYAQAGVMDAAAKRPERLNTLAPSAGLATHRGAEVSAPLLTETSARLSNALSRLADVAMRTRSTKNAVFGATPEPTGTGGNQAKDMPMGDIIRNQLGALEHLTGMLESETAALINQLV